MEWLGVTEPRDRVDIERDVIHLLSRPVAIRA
jgi:hypothetical protein